jgi:hypothetical protein
MMPKVDDTGGVFCDFAHHAGTTAVVMSGLGYS